MSRSWFSGLCLAALLAGAPSPARSQVAKVCKPDEVGFSVGNSAYCVHVAPVPLAAPAAVAYCKARRQSLLSMFTLAAAWNVNPEATAALKPLVLNKKMVVAGIAWSKGPSERYKITTPVEGGLRNLPAEPYKDQVLHYACSSDVPLPKKS